MKIKSVIENTSDCGLPVEHGLCLWIEACGHKFFFDLGQTGLFAENATQLGIDIGQAEFAVISHGHYDHGGGIQKFIEENNHAPIYLHKSALGEHYSMKETGPRYIGLSKKLYSNRQIIFTEGIKEIGEGIILFEGCDGQDYYSPANKRILKKEDGCFTCDTFAHEQSLIIIEGDNTVLIAGCAHSGILNIIRKAEKIIGQNITHVIAGLHLSGVEDEAFIDNFGNALLLHDCQYYTCHCTGEQAYKRLKRIMGDRICYLSSGESLIV